MLVLTINITRQRGSENAGLDAIEIGSEQGVLQSSLCEGATMFLKLTGVAFRRD
jgi:hypothetical protein